MLLLMVLLADASNTLTSKMHTVLVQVTARPRTLLAHVEDVMAAVPEVKEWTGFAPHPSWEVESVLVYTKELRDPLVMCTLLLTNARLTASPGSVVRYFS